LTLPLSFGSLFSGIGGFDLGLERAGMECAWQVEIDPACLSVLAAHWPAVPRLEDVTHVQLADLPAPVDLICGGFPCQDLSVAGRRAGLAGERSGLWFEFHRILAEARPRWCIIENVPGLLSSNGGRDFAVILRGLEQLGYHAAWRVLDAQYFGVPQRRRRVFVVGSLGNYASLEVLLEPESLSGDSPPGRETGQRIAEGSLSRALSRVGGGNDPGANKGAALVFESRFARNDRGGPDVIVPPLKAQSGQSGKGDGAPLVFDARGNGMGALVSTLTGDHMGRVTDYMPVVIPDPAYSISGQGTRFGSGRHNQDTFVVAAPLRSRQSSPGVSMPGRGGEDDENLVIAGVSENQRAETRLTDYASPVTAGGGKPGQGYPAALQAGLVRRLTPTECERLMGFPDGWTAGHADSSRYRMLGNAVCVPVAEWIGRRILR